VPWPRPADLQRSWRLRSRPWSPAARLCRRRNPGTQTRQASALRQGIEHRPLHRQSAVGTRARSAESRSSRPPEALVCSRFVLTRARPPLHDFVFPGRRGISRVNHFNRCDPPDRGSIRCRSRFISCSELRCRTHAEATARYGDRYQVDARLITHTLNHMTRSRRKARPMAFRKEFRRPLGRKLLRHHGAQITRPISKRHRPGYGRRTRSSGALSG